MNGSLHQQRILVMFPSSFSRFLFNSRRAPVANVFGYVVDCMTEVSQTGHNLRDRLVISNRLSQQRFIVHITRRIEGWHTFIR